MSDQPEPTTATVARLTTGWVVRVYGSDTELISETPLDWDGSGGFYQDGLDAVARAKAIPDGIVYEGSQAWDRLGDDSYAVVLHREDPRFGGG